VSVCENAVLLEEARFLPRETCILGLKTVHLRSGIGIVGGSGSVCTGKNSGGGEGVAIPMVVALVPLVAFSQAHPPNTGVGVLPVRRDLKEFWACIPWLLRAITSGGEWRVLGSWSGGR
jgi:hypothetical protein